MILIHLKIHMFRRDEKLPLNDILKIANDPESLLFY